MHAGEVPASAEVAERFEVATGTPVITRQRVMFLDDVPVELTDSYYPMDVAGGTRLAGTAKIPGGAVTLLAEMGHRARRVHEEVYARIPDEAERRALLLSAGEPVLCMTRVTEDESRPFQVDVSVFPAAGQRLRYELRTG
jgi:DNA-binding GntR family transcriptional regulator